MYPVWSFFILRRSFTYLLMGSLMVAGIYALLIIPKESTPEIEVPVGIVTVVMPGAGAPDVEKLVTNKLERELINTLDNVKKVTSTSGEGLAQIVVEFNADADIDESIQSLKDEVDKIKSLLPEEAEDPAVLKIDFVNQPMITFAVASDLSQAEFTQLANDLETELKTIKGVSKVVTGGLEEREVTVVVDVTALDNFNLKLTDVVAAISATNSALPVGSITVDGIVYNLRFEGDIRSSEEINDIAILSSAGEPIYIRDVARVIDAFADPVTLSRVSQNGSPATQALQFSVFKKSGGDITSIGADIRERLESLQETGELLDNTQVLILYDLGQLISDDLSNLSVNGLQTIGLVLVILLITIGWREAIVAALAIPLSFLVAFIGLYASGNTVNFISLFALILAVGILVDSAIVVVEGMSTKLKEGFSGKEAALETIREFELPLIAGTLATIVVFAPLFLISGITGEFIANIPFTVIIVLVASIIVALGFVPLLVILIVRPREPSPFMKQQDAYTDLVLNWYRGVLNSFIGQTKKENRFLATLIIGFLIAVALPVVGVVEVAFFPQDDVDNLYLEIEEAEGTDLLMTDLEVRKIEEILYQDSRIESFVTTIGQSSQFAESKTNFKLANIFIHLKADRDETSTEVVESLREELAGIHTSLIRVLQEGNGPPVGDPIAVKLLGDDLAELDKVASEVTSILSGIKGTADIRSSTQNNGTEFVLKINKPEATSLGLNSVLVAQTLRSAVYGTEATTIKGLADDIPIRVKLNLNDNYRESRETNQVNIDAIKQIPIATPTGSVLLGSILDISIAKSSNVILHEEGKRVVTVSGQVESDGNARKIISEFLNLEDQIEIPRGVELIIGGENEEVDQSFRDMFVALIIGLVALLATMVLQFNSFRYALFIISIVPFSLIGIMFGLGLAGKALSFTSMLGFISLSGIVVNNSIILVDVMNKLREKNPLRPIREVVIEGAVLRLRPILLTTITTVIGIIPLLFSSELWEPFAFAIMFGLSFSVIITLLMVPIIYHRWPGKLDD